MAELIKPPLPIGAKVVGKIEIEFIDLGDGQTSARMFTDDRGINLIEAALAVNVISSSVLGGVEMLANNLEVKANGERGN